MIMELLNQQITILLYVSKYQDFTKRQLKRVLTGLKEKVD